MRGERTIKKLVDMYFSKNVLPFWCILLLDSIIVFLSSLFAYWVSNRTGTMFEHPILDAVDKDINKDRQILLEDLRLRVNYDGDKNGIIYEVKTHTASKPFLTKNATYQFLPKHIYGQVQVQMYAWKTAHKNGEDIPPLKKLYVVEYALYEEDYFGKPEVDSNRIKFHKVTYDKGFIKQYTKRLEPLVKKMLEEWNGEET